MDVVPVFTELVSKKVQTADLKNVRVVKSDAMDTGLDAESIDTVLLFSVIPSPTLPLNRFLPEMLRVLKPEGTLAVTSFHWESNRFVDRSYLRIPANKTACTVLKKRLKKCRLVVHTIWWFPQMPPLCGWCIQLERVVCTPQAQEVIPGRGFIPHDCPVK